MLTNFLALDVGQARVGVALANDVARIAAPLPAIAHDEHFMEALLALISEHHVATVIVGWPRGLDGQETEQTRYVAGFIAQLEAELVMSVVKQDEAVTSVQAEAELRRRGGSFAKEDIDSLSAVYILEDYLADKVH